MTRLPTSLPMHHNGALAITLFASFIGMCVAISAAMWSVYQQRKR